MQLVNLLKIIFIINSVENIIDCVENLGFLIILPNNSPCKCNEVICHEKQVCDQDKGCMKQVKNPLDQIELTGSCSFDEIFIDDQMNTSIRLMNNKFDTIKQIENSVRVIIDIGNQYYIPTSIAISTKFTKHCHDLIIKKVKWENDQVVNSIYIQNVDTHEMQLGNNDNEVLMILRIRTNFKESNDGAGILIIDFETNPPTYNVIKVINQVTPQTHWGHTSSQDDWNHFNTAGTTLQGDQFINARQGSFLMFFDRQTQDLKQTIATEPNIHSDYTFPNPEDKTYMTHDTHQLPNGNQLAYDNGNLRPQRYGGPYTRCIEQTIDHLSKTVKKVWEFIPNPKLLCFTTGSCRRLSNGNTLIAFTNCVTLDLQQSIDDIYHKHEQRENYIQDVDKDGNVNCIGSIAKSEGNVQRATPKQSAPKITHSQNEHNEIFNKEVLDILAKLNGEQN